MLDVPAERLKPNRVAQRPPFERIALLLQGGGALGAYQAGVYQALAEANLHPDWVAGISIGAVNAALIAGNPPEKRVEKLREFWETVSATPLGPIPFQYARSIQFQGLFPSIKSSIRYTHSSLVLLGTPHFFTPRPPPPFLFPQGAPTPLAFTIPPR